MNEQSQKNRSKIKEMVCSFTDHPRLADETYFQHLWFTMKMSGTLFLSAIVIVLHGIFPFICSHTASNKVTACQKILDERARMTSPDKKIP